MKRLSSQDLGTKKKRAEPFTADKIEELWRRGVLGDQDPQTLLDMMIFMCVFLLFIVGRRIVTCKGMK